MVYGLVGSERDEERLWQASFDSFTEGHQGYRVLTRRTDYRSWIFVIDLFRKDCPIYAMMKSDEAIHLLDGLADCVLYIE